MSLKSILLKPVFKFKFNYNIFKPWRWNWQKVKEFLKIFLLATCIVLAFLSIYYFIIPALNDQEEISGESLGEEVIDYLNYYFTNYSGTDPFTGQPCNVVGIKLHGSLLSYLPPKSLDEDGNLLEDEVSSQDIVGIIQEAEKNDKIKAIFLEVDSYGGEPVAGEEVSNAIKYAKKPTVALIRGAGASAAYLAATGANKIFASKYSDVGGIGVTSSYVENVRKNKNEGLDYVSLSVGKFKDTGDPNRSLSPEEKNLIMRDGNIIYNNFVTRVAENRKIDIKKVAKLADGSTMLGEMALKSGLIDQIGNQYNVEQYLKTKIGTDASVCWQD